MPLRRKWRCDLRRLGSNGDTRLGMQMNYDLAQIQAEASSLKVTRLAPA
jgi:hypothetical protein